jgi:hypothetical protein
MTPGILTAPFPDHRHPDRASEGGPEAVRRGFPCACDGLRRFVT